MIDDDEQLGRILSRREALLLLGGAAAVILPACGSSGKSTASPATSSTVSPATSTTAATTATTAAAVTATTVAVATRTWVVKPELTEGPYFVDEKLNRSDIRADPSGGPTADGVPLTLAFRASRVGSAGCVALAGANVDVWQCDATG